MDNRISFTSNIRFINRKKFVDTVGDVLSQTGKFHLFRTQNIIVDPNKESYSYLPKLITKAVRTCSAGGLVNPGESSCIFHFFDTPMEANIDALKNIVNSVKPKNGLLIGGKRVMDSPYSLKNFENIEKFLKDKVQNLSIFKEHKFFLSQSSFYYTRDTDTYMIFSHYLDNQNTEQEVTTLNKLLKIFGEIKIAKGDRLFIENKEILPKNCPSIFCKDV